MLAKRVVVVPYNDGWKSDFERIKQYLLTAVKDKIICIEHIGSTSVEGLSAKPIIDIDIVIKDYSVFNSLVDSLASLGYIHEGNLGIKDREAFDYRGNTDLPKHHLYVCPEFSAELHRHISFRDYLRNNRDTMLKYSKMKEYAAELYPDNIDDYIAYKSPCIEEIYKKCGFPNMKYKAIFFDRDGTLTYFTTEKETWRDKQISRWSGKPFELSYEKMMDLFRLASEGKKPWYKTLDDEREFFKRYYYHLLIGEGITENVEDKAECLFSELWCNGDRALFPETTEVLEYFNKQGYKIGVISDTSPSLEFTLQQLGIAKYFTSFIASSLVGAGKPSPIIFNAALDSQGVTADESIFVDDCKEEADGAREQGFTSFYLDRSGNNKDKWTIHNLKQLIDFVETESPKTAMPDFNYLNKSDFPEISLEIFNILADNMEIIAPTGNTRDEDYKYWYEGVSDGLKRNERQIVLIKDADTIIGFFQYYTNADTFMMEEIQVKREYQGKNIFRKLYGFLISNISEDIKFVEAYANITNHKSIGILEKLGLAQIGTNKNGHSFHFKGNYSDLLKWYNSKK